FPEQSGVAKEEMISLVTGARKKDRFGLDRRIWFYRSGLRTKPMGWVLQGRLVDPPVDPSRMPRMTAWPGNNEDTDVQTRDCARFKSTEPFEGRQGISRGYCRTCQQVGADWRRVAGWVSRKAEMQE